MFSSSNELRLDRSSGEVTGYHYPLRQHLSSEISSRKSDMHSSFLSRVSGRWGEMEWVFLNILFKSVRIIWEKPSDDLVKNFSLILRKCSTSWVIFIILKILSDMPINTTITKVNLINDTMTRFRDVCSFTTNVL